MKLRDFQSEALDLILHSYSAGARSALLIMPAGTGKTFLSITIFQSMIDIHDLDSMAYVASNTIMQSTFDRLVDESLGTESQAVKSYSYRELSEIVQNNRIEPDQFKVIVFDDVTENSQSLVGNIFDFFTGFKIGFSRTDLPKSKSLFGVNDDFNIVYKYSLNQALTDGFFLESQKALYMHSLNNLVSQLNDIDIGSDWSQSIRQSLIQNIDLFRKENAEYLEAQELLLSGKIKTAEILEMSHRKEQLDTFGRMLNDIAFFEQRAKESNGDESAWQEFFEFNPWIFGFGLNYIFNSPLDGKKLEQTVEGYSVKGHGKRTDALLKSTGLIQTLCFGEIKTHRKNILKKTKTPYRSDSWAISDEIAGGISQIHRTVQNSLNNLNNALSLYDEEGYKLKNPIYLYKPKAFLIIGSLNEFRNKEGDIHEEKFSSFELFRKSISDVEIITFDELYERANAIVNKRWSEVI